MPHLYNTKTSWLGGRYGVVLLVFVVCLLFIGVWIYQIFQERKRAIALARVNIANLVRIIEEANNRTLQAVDITLDDVEISVNSGRCGAGTDTNAYLRSLLNESPQVRELAFADSTGQITAMSRREVPGILSIEHTVYFNKARAGTLPPLYISTPRPGRLLGDASQDEIITDQWHLIMARAVHNDSGIFVGVALAVINPGFFQDQIHALDIGDKGYVAYYRYDGKLLMTGAFGSLHLGNENHVSEPLFTQHLPKQEWGTFIQNQSTGGGDATYIVSYRATSRWPLLVTVALEQDEVLASWRREARGFSLLIAGSLVVSLGLAIMVYRQHLLQEQMAQRLVEAHHDPLTGIPSLRLCMDRLSNALIRVRREDELLAIFFIDLDAFKAINDNYGHDAGDYVLKEVAGRLCSCVRQMDTVSRLGGDEFLIVLPKISDLSVVGKISKNILESVLKPMQWGNNVLSVSASIGIAVSPKHGVEPKQLIKKADKAMYEAKKNGKNQYALAKEDHGV